MKKLLISVLPLLLLSLGAYAQTVPSINSTPVTTATQDAAYSYDADASDPDPGEVLTFSVQVNPGWLSIDPNSGVLSGIPTNAYVGANDVTIRVTGVDELFDDQAFVINVADVNEAPSITSTAITTATQDAAYSYDADASDPDPGEVLTFSVQVNPGWLSIDPNSGLLTGTPTNAYVGANNVTIRVADDDGLFDDQAFVINVTDVNEAPSITSTAITTATQDAAYSYDADASDPDPGEVLTFSVQVNPGWLSIDPNSGLLTGTPTNAYVGANNVTIRVADDGGLFDDQAFVINVTDVNEAPSITSTAITTATQDAAYSYDADASDPDPGEVLTFSVQVNPGWLSIDPNSGLLTGTPTNAYVGANNVTIRVADDGGLFDDQAFVINVTDVNEAPSITSTAITTATQDAAYSYDADASDPDPGEVLTFSVQVNPGWLSIDPNSGLLTGTPTNAYVGANNVTIRVADDGGLFDDQAFVINVTDVNDAPSITSTAITTATQDAAYSYDADASDPDPGEVLTFSVQVNPGWLSIDPNSGLLTGTPTNAYVGANNVTIRVADDGGLFDDQVFVIDVANVNDAPTITSAAITVATEDIAYSYTITASDIDIGDILTFTAPTHPSWLTFDAGTQELYGTPTNDDVGINNVTLRVSDGLLSVDQIFTITVSNTNDAPTFNSAPIITATQGSPYTYTASAEDIDGDSIIFRAPVLPVWLTFNDTTHILRGTPGNEHVGVHPVLIRINDGTVDVDQSFLNYRKQY